MDHIKSVRNCCNYKSVNNDGGPPFRRVYGGSCKDCVYFSSRNCGMDAADDIEPDIELFM